MTYTRVGGQQLQIRALAPTTPELAGMDPLIQRIEEFSIDLRGRAYSRKELMLTAGMGQVRKNSKQVQGLLDRIMDDVLTPLPLRYKLAKYLIPDIAELLGDNRQEIVKQAHNAKEQEDKEEVLGEALADT